MSLPWTGGRFVQLGPRTWKISGALPNEFGWYRFLLDPRRANVIQSASPSIEILKHKARGFLVGDRLVLDDARVDPDPQRIISCSERVFLIDDSLDRFQRIIAGRAYENGPLIYCSADFPIGVEDMVLEAYLDRRDSLRGISGVTPALEAAFRMEMFQRAEADRRRAELARLRQEEDARRQREARQREIAEQLGDAAGRRRMAQIDFGEAARAALAVGGAEYLDHRPSHARHEFIVRFRFQRQRFECVCDEALRIIDAGICLKDSDTGEQGDNYFTLESLPSVIAEAIRDGVLVVLRRTA